MKRSQVTAALAVILWIGTWASGRPDQRQTQAALRAGSAASVAGDSENGTSPTLLAPGEPERLGLQEPRLGLPTEGAPSLGPMEAPIEIVVFSDFQCPYCARLEPLLRQIHQLWPKEVRVVVKDFPLSSHPSARLAAEAAAGAAAQGCYWPMREALFEFFEKRKGPLTREKLSAIAAAAGLDAFELDRALGTGEFAGAVDRDLSDGAAAGVSSTPSIFIDGWLWRGQRTIGEIRPAIELLLAARGLRLVRHVTRVSGREDGICDEDCSLREALAAANLHKGPEVVRLAPGRWSVHPGDLPFVSDDLTIAGDPSGSTVLQTAAGHAPFWAARSGVRLSLAELTIASSASGRPGHASHPGTPRRPPRPEDMSPPSEARNLHLAGRANTTLTWDPPADPGDPYAEIYFDVLRSDIPSDFSWASCLLTDGAELTMTDSDPLPPSVTVWFYLVRSRSRWGSALGTYSDGTPRTGVICMSDPGRVCASSDECYSGCCSSWGFCADTYSDSYNCGTCGFSCADLPNVDYYASLECDWGSCVITPDDCMSGYQHCSSNPLDGCESNSWMDVANCGSCGNDCRTLPNVDPNAVYCDGGCVIPAGGCLAGFQDCNPDPSDGCEIDITLPDNCGSCGNNCWNIPNAASVSCVGGGCVVDACQSGYDFCDESHTSCCEAVVRGVARRTS